MKVKKTLPAIIVLVCMMMSAFSGCTIKSPGEGTTVRITKSFKENELFFLEEELCTVSEAKIFLMNQKNLYTSRYGREIWSATYEGEPLYTYLEANLRDFLVRLKCMVLMAEMNEVTLSADDQTLISLATDHYYKALSEAELSYCDATKEDISEAFSDYFLANKLYRVLTQDATKEISNDEARVITAQMIYLPFDEANTAEQTIHELHQRVTQAEEDFYSVAENYNKGPWTEAQICRGEMETAFEEAAFSLSSDAISKVVTGDNGYYIIKCINNHEKELTNLHREELIEQWKKEVFRNAYDDFVGGIYLRFNDTAWDLIDFGAVVPEYSDSFYNSYEKFLSGNE